jgi:hypothetical protein
MGARNRPYKPRTPSANNNSNSNRSFKSNNRPKPSPRFKTAAAKKEFERRAHNAWLECVEQDDNLVANLAGSDYLEAGDVEDHEGLAAEEPERFANVAGEVGELDLDSDEKDLDVGEDGDAGQTAYAAAVESFMALNW